ncbi:MAG: cation transporter [Deltaproteobacteria bacterium]|nr:cation transporter [Deltaproteobacteria bacterium]
MNRRGRGREGNRGPSGVDEDRHDHDDGQPTGLKSYRRARLGPEEDRCEVAHDARIVHPHGAGKAVPHVHAGAQDRQRLVLSLCITGAILLIELIGGILARSMALLSDAGHMFTDLTAQVLSLFALLFAMRPADARRTYGYYRMEILAALANGTALVVLGGTILYGSYRRLESPMAVKTEILIPIAVIGLLANALGAWLLHGSHSLNVRAAYMHVLSDALSSLAVVVGGVVMAWRRGMYVIDPILGLGIGVVVIVNAYRLVRDAADVLLEAVPGHVDLERVREDVRALDGIEDVHDLHIWTITSGLHALSAHIVVKQGTLVAANDELLTRVKELLLRRHRIAHSTLQIESTSYEHVSHVH